VTDLRATWPGFGAVLRAHQSIGRRTPAARGRAIAGYRPSLMTHVKRPAVGCAMALGAAAFFAVNGTVSKLALSGELDATALTALRGLGAFLGLAGFLAVTSPARLRVGVRELPFLATYGVVGVALTQWLYFVAIGRLPIGIALLLEFTAPVLIAVWARFVLRERVSGRVWWALTLALAGLAMVARIWVGGTLDGLGVTAGLCAAVALASYYLLGERGVTTRDPISLTCWSMAAAALFWAFVRPPWTFGGGALTERIAIGGPLGDGTAPSWALLLAVVVTGTIVPFSLSMAALRHLPATTVGIVGMTEPVLAGGVAWLWLGETLAPVQLVGSAVVIVGIGLAQTARTSVHMVEVDVPVAAHDPAQPAERRTH
jgi:drug/metabolite transporter (DMT)-like permease